MFIQEEYFKNIFNTVREAILILDEDMRVLSANRSFFAIFKVDAANTIGSLLYDLGNGQWNIPHLRVLLDDILPKNDTVDDYEIEHKFESIGHKTMLLNACKIREKKADQPIILLAIEDITERKKLEELLTESEERYRRLFETASDGIVLLEKHEGHITHANPAAEKMLGYPIKECIGKKLQDIGVSIDMSDFPTIMQTLSRSGIINYADVPVRTKSGQHIDTDIYIVDRAMLAQCNIRDVTERKRTEEELRQSEKKYKDLFDSTLDGIYQMDADGFFIMMNPAGAKMFGYESPDELIGKKGLEYWRDPGDRDIFRAELKIKKSVSGYNMRLKKKNGEPIELETTSTIKEDEKGVFLRMEGILRDVTERKQKEEELGELTRILRARNGSSHAMMEAEDELWYLNEVCRIIVEDCGYAMVWIGFADDNEEKTVRPVAYAGFEEGYIESLNTTWADRDYGRGPVGTAIRTGYPVIIHDVVTDDRFAPWRAEALRRGYASVISVPLLFEKKAFGSLNIYSGRPNSFTEEEAVLLTDLAADLSYGIAAIRIRSAQAEAEEALRDSEAKYRTLVDNSLVGIYRSNLEGKFLYVNEAMAKIFECESPEEMVLEDVLLRYKDSGDRETLLTLLKNAGKVSNFEVEVPTKTGKHINILISASLEGPVISGMVMDITDIKRAEQELVRLYQRVKEEAEISGALVKIVNALNASLSETELVRNVLTLAPGYLRFDRIAIFFYDESLKGLTFAGGYGLSPADEGMLVSKTFRERDFPAMSRFLKGETVRIEKALGSDLLTKELVATFEIGSILLVPIMIRGKVMGGIVGDCRSSEAIEDRDVSLMQGLADGMAIALQNSRLYRESIERLMELTGKIETIETMASLDKEILSNLDRAAILKTAVALINRVIPSERTAVFLKEGDIYRAASEWGLGELRDKTYVIKGSHFESFEKGRISLYLSDISKDDCPYHKDQHALGIKSTLMIPLITKAGIIGFLDIASVHHGRLTPAHLSTAEKIASQIAVALENARLYEDLQQLLIGVITSLASAIDAKSPWTNGHSARVTKYAVEIGKELGLKEHDLEWLRLSGLLHDVGKIGTYDIVLDKPGKLTDGEFELVKKHPRKGAEILASIKQLNDVIPGVLHHHERYDGRGYPDGLKGEDIPLQARILCVADSFDSMTADRPYRTSPGKEYAISEFKRCSGLQFDPGVVEAFLKVLERT